jgi:hypothetical protein
VKSFSNFSLQVLECVQKLKEGMARQRPVEAKTEARDIPAEIPEVKFSSGLQKTSGTDVTQALSNGQPSKNDIVGGLS